MQSTGELLPGGLGSLKKRFQLQGHSAEELERRLELFRQALQARRGAILRVKRVPRAPGRCSCAIVHYAMPVASLRGTSPSWPAFATHDEQSATTV